MDIEAILKQLRDEREHLEMSILAIERLQAGQGKRRGRPPAWLTAIKTTAVKTTAVKTAAAKEPAGPKKRGRPAGSRKKTEVEGT
jgi:hypothetical protein